MRILLAAAVALLASGCGYRLVEIQIDKDRTVGIAVKPGTVIAIQDVCQPNGCPAATPAPASHKRRDD